MSEPPPSAADVATPVESGTVPWRDAVVYLVVATAAMAPLDVNVVGPALPAIADAFGIPNARASLVITAFALPGIALAPVVGALADRYGRRRVLVPCLAIYGVAGTLVGTVDSFVAVLALRVVQGTVGGSILASMALAVAGDLYRGPQRNAVVGVTSAGITLSAAVSPMLGGLLADVSWRAPFGLYAVSVGVAIAVARWLPESGPARGDARLGRAYLRAAVRTLPLRRAAALYLATFASFGLFFGGVLTGVTFLLDEGYGLASGPIGTLITGALLFGAVVAALNGRFARRASDPTLIALGFLAYGSGLAVTWLAGSPPGVFAGLWLFGAGHGLVVPSAASALAGLGPDRYRAGVMSLRTSVVLASQAVGPPAFVLAGAALGYEGALLAGGVLAVVGGAGALLALRR